MVGIHFVNESITTKSKHFVDSVVHTLVRILLFQVSHVELTFVQRGFVQISFYKFRLSVLLPVVEFELFLHNVVLLLVPHQVVCKFNTAHDSDGQTHISS